MKFKLVRKQTTIEIEDAAGVTQAYVLRELSGKERETYMSLMQSKTVLDKKGNATGLKDCMGLETTLVSLSLSLNDKRVPVAEIETWPAQVLAGIARMAKQLSSLEQPDEEDEGNV